MSNDHFSPVQEGQDETGATLSTQGKNISYHIHHYCSEVWTFVEGESICVLNSVEQRVKVGDTVVILGEHFQVIKAIIPLTFIEVQIGNSLVEEDIEGVE